MLVGMIVLVVGILAASTVTLYLLQHREMTNRIDDSLRRATSNYQRLVTAPNDSETGKPYASVSDILYRAMQSTQPAEHEGHVAILDGALRWTAPDTVGVRLEDDPQFMSWAAGAEADGKVYIRTITTDLATYRAVSLPASIRGGDQVGHYVAAYDLTAERRSLYDSFLPFVWISLGLIVAGVVTSWFLVGRMLRPLRDLRETAQSITQTDLSRRIGATGTDDLAELSRTFDSMLDRVESALDSHKELLDDVGHELRTPVTIVRGHLELVDPADPGDVRETRELALDELDRMALLIDDLLLLAKSDHVDFVRPLPVPLDELTADVFAKAKLLGDREWTFAAESGLTVMADPQRITQAALQLCENAVKYSDPGSAIHVSAHAFEPGYAALRVTDHGRGISSRDREKILERFVRGISSAGTKGSGLGLAISSAIISAHGGRLDIKSAEDEGSTFTIVLPTTQASPKVL